jgi:hypothetical protein
MKDWGSDMDESVAAMMLLATTGGILMVAWAWSDLFAWALELSSTTRWVVFWGIVLGVAARILFWLKPWHDDAADCED